MTLQNLINYIGDSKLRDCSPLVKKNIKAARAAVSHFYTSSWLTNIDKFLRAIAWFKKITICSQNIDSSIQKSITSAMTSAIAPAVDAIQAKHKSKMLSLRKIIEKSLLFRDFPLFIPLPDPDAVAKAYFSTNSLPKAFNKR